MKHKPNRLKSFVSANIAPILLAAYPIIYLFSENFDRMRAVEVFSPILITVSIALFLCWLVSKRGVSPERAAIILSFWIIYFFSFRLLSKIPMKLGLVENRSLAVVFVQVIGVGLLIWFSLWCIYTRKKTDWLSSFLKIGSFCLVLIGLSSITYKAFRAEKFVVSIGPEINPGLGTSRATPDIYYVLLDGFGRFDVLRGMYGVDTSDFEERLKSLGFYIADYSQSNYIQTLLSLSSTLNMGYLDELARTLPKGSKNRDVLIDLVRDSKVVNFLKTSGYKTYSFSSGYSGTDLINTDERASTPWVLSEFHNLILRVTPLPTLMRQLGIFKWQYSAHRRRLNFIFDTLPKLGKDTSPKFVFAHVMAPHPPFVFNSKGGDVWRKRKFVFGDGSHFDGRKREYIADYGGQVTFLMTKIADIVEEIAMRDPFAVIILQGDHGPGLELNWGDRTKSNLWERTSILNAYRMGAAWPGEVGLRADVSPVNTFRLVLDEIFKLNIPELPDRTFYSSWGQPYNFIELSEEDLKPRISTCRPSLSGRVGQIDSEC